jgi:hypothetical protein
VLPTHSYPHCAADVNRAEVLFDMGLAKVGSGSEIKIAMIVENIECPRLEKIREVDVTVVTFHGKYPFDVDVSEGNASSVVFYLEVSLVNHIRKPDTVGVVVDLPCSPVRQVAGTDQAGVVINLEASGKCIAGCTSGDSTGTAKSRAKINRTEIVFNMRLTREDVSMGVAARSTQETGAPEHFAEIDCPVIVVDIEEV